MHCEIEFLAVGEASRAGDAIVLRYGYDHNYELMLVDGGHAETGDQIVEHLRQQFGPNPILQHVVLTHSDADHASGLRTVLSELTVRNLWLHIPWAHADLDLFSDKRFTFEGLQKKIEAEYEIISEILELARTAGCNIQPAFQGADIGPFKVLSPKENTYRYLVPQFDRTPDPDQAVIEAANMWIGKESVYKKLIEMAKAAAKSWIKESWTEERLRDGGITSASNESSVVLYGAFENELRVLLTGDAGVNALWWAANYAAQIGLPLQQFTFVQIPHHGSRRNVGPSVLDNLIGPAVPEGTAAHFQAYVSAPADDDKHPRRIVLNAFKRRGGRIIATQGVNKVHWGGFSPRPGYTACADLPFYTEVEEYT
ncbi:MBL fold metallo-hydrolase [Rhodoplanes sp. TEM]|uniref:MBL fold metallo-hydrolase n=1 Tax=Rhodoplanes tepidamans TaxID=200616 RepID=A0ABT5J7J0_RHOTP|nr:MULTISPECIES: MBL fold metallo-hydrolase [Rhodoplanes]MDC7785626.1 MBL fold metallo-hydrolase [Rhodoplanes tepidamans]MDC7985727.1 MBL fold metallo-hydrolase [Rhodoplanes sp. TEM]MDQ0354808.1 hypothetical protein [Rhodoplanes tepidamans]